MRLIAAVVAVALVVGPLVTERVAQAQSATSTNLNRGDEAAQEASLDEVSLEPVVVTADREAGPLKDSPETIMVISEDEIRTMNATSTGAILESIPGINIETGTGSGYPSRSIVSLNGLPANYTLVLVNGQKLLTEHIHTGQNVDMIPPESIERIEVVRTAASAQYGSDAIGGLVNIITKRSGEEMKAKLYGSWGSYMSANGGVSVVAPVSDRATVSMFVDFDRTDGIPILAPAHRLDNMGYDRVSLLNNVEMDIADWLELDLYANYFENRMDWAGEEMRSRLIMPKGGLRFDLPGNWQINATAEYSSWSSDLSSETNELLVPRGRATWKALEDRNLLTFGGEYQHHWFRRTGLENTREQEAFGFFAHDRFKLNRHWSFSGSVRLDKPEDIDPVVSPKLAVLYRPMNRFGIRAAVGRGFHAPTVQELYEQAYGHGGTALRFGNEELQPETSSAFSLSLETDPVDSLQILVNGYAHLIDNFITPVYAGPWDEDPTKDKWIRTNILRAWLYGGEVQAKWSPVDWLKLDGGYSYAANRDESDDQQLSFHPGHSLHGRLELALAVATHYTLGAFARAGFRTGRRAWSWKPAEGAPRDSEEGYITELEDYALLDAGAQLLYKKRYKLYIAVTNILGEDIQKLDDALTILDGQPLYRVGFKLEF